MRVSGTFGLLGALIYGAFYPTWLCVPYAGKGLPRASPRPTISRNAPVEPKSAELPSRIFRPTTPTVGALACYLAYAVGSSSAETRWPSHAFGVSVVLGMFGTFLLLLGEWSEGRGRTLIF